MNQPAPIADLPSPAPDDFMRAVAKLEAATRFLDSRYIEHLIAQSIKAAVLQAASPLCDRAGAAALALCSVDQIDAAAKAGIIQRYPRGETPLFDKAEIIEAIKGGKWKFSARRFRGAKQELRKV